MFIFMLHCARAGTLRRGRSCLRTLESSLLRIAPVLRVLWWMRICFAWLRIISSLTWASGRCTTIIFTSASTRMSVLDSVRSIMPVMACSRIRCELFLWLGSWMILMVCTGFRSQLRGRGVHWNSDEVLGTGLFEVLCDQASVLSLLHDRVSRVF